MQVRQGGHVTTVAVVLATGVRGDGHREILGVDLGESESETFSSEFFAGLKGRGLHGVRWSSQIATGPPSRYRWSVPRSHLATLPSARHAQPPRRGPTQAATHHLRADTHHVFPNPTPQQPNNNSAALSTSYTKTAPESPNDPPRAQPICWPTVRSHLSTGPRSGPTTPPGASTENSNDEPTSCKSPPTPNPLYAS